VIIFFDRNAGKRIPSALTLLNPPFEIRAHHELFAQDTPDDEWLTAIGKAGWVVIGFDRKFHRRTSEAVAFVAHGVGCFYLSGANWKTWDRFRVFIRVSDWLIDLAQNTPRPFIFRVDSRGVFRQVDLARALEARRQAAAARTSRADGTHHLSRWRPGPRCASQRPKPWPCPTDMGCLEGVAHGVVTELW